MRVLLVSSGSGSRGGGEIYLTFLAQGLANLGCEVSAIVPDAERMDELATALSQSAEVERLPFQATYQRRTRLVGAILDTKQQARFAGEFQKRSPDIIHLNQQVAEDALDLVKAASGTGLPWVSTIHVSRTASELGARFGAARDTLAMRVLRKSGGDFIPVSEASRLQLERRLGTGDWRLHVVRNGVPASGDAIYAQARQIARRDWKVGETDVVVGVVGRIEAQKNPLALVDYAAKAMAGSRLKLVWIGDGSLRPSLESVAATHEDKLSLIVDGWRNDAATRMAGFDIFVLPSKFEGLPLALLEAMHAGLPVIAARTDGMVEAIREGRTGFLCETDKEWSGAIARLAGDPAQRRRIGLAAKDSATAEFGVESMAARTLAVYKSAISRRQGQFGSFIANS